MKRLTVKENRGKHDDASPVLLYDHGLPPDMILAIFYGT